MSSYTQAKRPVRIATPLGEDVLLLRKMTGGEELGRPFRYELVLLSEDHDINYKDIIGENVTVLVDKGDREARFFNGFISRFTQSKYERKLAEYRATMVPWPWFLTRSSDCRIFQAMTVPDILKQVFEDHGFSDVKYRLHGTYKPWEYCVQYRETAFDFVSRLMEQEGIYYFFKHENGKHHLVLCDTMGSHLEFKGYEQLKFHLPGDSTPGYETVWSWMEQHEIQSGAYTVREFSFKNPRSGALGATHHDRQHAGSQFEQFDYLGEMDAEADHDRYSKLRLEQLQAEHELYFGEGDARGICTGVRFTLQAHPRKDFNKEYLTVANELRIESDPFETKQDASGQFVYAARLTAIPVASTFRSQRITPRPLVQGPQTAMVVGPSGEELYTDKYGRVKVQFHWDRYGKADENSSCWVRVAQSLAGKGWGAVTLPRVGQEVVVEFLDGNPDRPLITGGVYNELAVPPYELPAHKTITTHKSNSSKGGKGFNEIRFEDNKGEEQLFFHAEKDQEIRIKNDLKEWIGSEAHQIVKKDQFESVEGKKHTQVKGERVSKIEGDHGETVKGDHHGQVEGDEHLTIKGEQRVKVSGDASFKTDKNLNQEAGMKISLKSGEDFHGKAGMSFALDAGTTVHIKGGTTIVIEAGAQVSLKAGPSFVDIGPSGVSISGPIVKINSGGAAASGSGSSPTAPAVPDVPDPPEVAKEAIKADPGQSDEPAVAAQPPKPVTYSSSAKVLQSAANDGTPLCEKCEEAAQQEEAKQEEEDSTA